MKILAIILIIGISQIYAQTDTPYNFEFEVNYTDLVILFTIIAVSVIGIFLYLSKDIILKKKTNYDTADLESKQDRDYEKYHSDWTDDYVEFDLETDIIPKDLPDYYKILDISHTASQKEIKKKYRHLAKQLHPDKTKNKDSSKMTQINQAYETLSDVQKRQRYDKFFK